MRGLILSAVIAGLALAGCDYGDPKLPLPSDDVGQNVPTGGGDGTIDPGLPDAGGGDGGLGADGGTSDGGVSDGGTVDGGTGDGGVAGTIAEVAANDPQLALLMMAVEKAGMTAALSDPSAGLTVFAPNNAAFAALLTELGLPGGFDDLSAEQLQAILRYHVLPTRLSSSEALNAVDTKVQALGGTIALSVERRALLLDGAASVTIADVQATNGVVHVIDRVLLPSIHDVLSTSSAFSSLSGAIRRADEATPSPGLSKRLDDDADALSVFAPDNAAFEAFVGSLSSESATGITGLDSFRADQLVPIVRYHVMGTKLSTVLRPATEVQSLGGTLSLGARLGAPTTVDGAAVRYELSCSNGRIQVVDAVLLPSISDVVSTDERFKSLASAIVAADAEPTLTRWVGDALDSPNEFTLFAPSNEAFTALGELPPGPSLANVLFFHAVPGRPLYSARLGTFTSPTPLLTSIDQPLVLQAFGEPPRITITDAMGGAASVSQVDLFTSNGVIHVIDRVLAPSL